MGKHARGHTEIWDLTQRSDETVKICDLKQVGSRLASLLILGS